VAKRESKGEPIKKEKKNEGRRVTILKHKGASKPERLLRSVKCIRNRESVSLSFQGTYLLPSLVLIGCSLADIPPCLDRGLRRGDDQLGLPSD